NDSGIRQPRPIDPARTGEQPRNIEQVRNPEQERPVRAGNIEAQQDDSGDDNQPMLPSFITGGRVTRDPVTDTASQAGNKDDSEKPESPKPRRRRRPVANTIQDGDNPAAEPEADEIAAGE
ncbi:MAG: hypothetical protein NWT00_06645, partial [Beijerinckiaceae bacterium]|nr:hypothetical protein [Beijerinckiaceae bacterium]